MNNQKSFIRWAGSKKRLLPELKKYWNESYKRYVEPFAGSAALFFSILPKEALLSDINEDLILTLKTVRDRPESTFKKLKEYPIGKDEYYKVRSLDTEAMSNIERSARFIYLNRFCFNGLYRTNLSGRFNVPYAGQKPGRLPEIEELLAASTILKNARLITCDFEKTISSVKNTDFVYLDPPYAVRNKRIFRQYGPDTFGLHDLERFSESLNLIERKGAKFLASYADCEEALEYFDKWNVRKVKTQRSIAGFSEHRGQAYEILVTNIVNDNLYQI